MTRAVLVVAFLLPYTVAASLAGYPLARLLRSPRILYVLGRIVPVALQGARERMPKGLFRIWPGTVTVKVLDPVDAGSYSYTARDLLVAEVRGRIAAALA